MRTVIIESPYAPSRPPRDYPELKHRQWERWSVLFHEAYARAAIRDSLRRGEAPFASHLLYTQPGVLDDTAVEERALRIAAGFAYRHTACLTAVYADVGVSSGMELGIAHARSIRCPIEWRMFLDGWGSESHTIQVSTDPPWSASTLARDGYPLLRSVGERIEDALSELARMWRAQ